MQIDVCEIVNNSELELRATEIQINKFNKVVLVLNKEVLVKELFVFVLEHHISKQYRLKTLLLIKSIILIKNKSFLH